jgi:adenylate kinase
MLRQANNTGPTLTRPSFVFSLLLPLDSLENSPPLFLLFCPVGIYVVEYVSQVKDRLEQDDCREKGWLLDGFPRTPGQADALAEAGVSADCFLFLNVPDEILVERVVGRRTDPETGKIYHLTFSPPADTTILNRLEQRSDDTEEKVKVRLEQFHANVDAVKDSYKDIMVVINGNQAPGTVSTTVLESIVKMSSSSSSTEQAQAA